MSLIHSLILSCALTSTVATRVPDILLPTTVPSHSRCEETRRNVQKERGAVQLDLHRVVKKRDFGEAGTTAIGLGDASDVTYNVLVQVGDISTPLVLDTGSADLWVLSNASLTGSNPPYPLYPPENFEPVADARLLYGDSRTGTHAFGLIGADRVGISGLVLEDQYFASINETNTSVLDTGSAGIFGLGFPVNSLLWNELYTLAASGTSSVSKRHDPAGIDFYSQLRSLPALPSFDVAQNLAAGDNITTGGSMGGQLEILSSFSEFGPLVSRLVLLSPSTNDGDSPLPFLDSPQFSVTLQRTTPAVGGNVGTITLGALPSGIHNSSLAWTPVRRYTQQQNGVVVPQAPNETYPYAWEIPLDAVYFDGVRLDPGTLGAVSMDGVGHSALVDTGNSLIRGPADVIVALLSMLLANTSSPSPFATPAIPNSSELAEEEYVSFTAEFESLAYAYPCEEAHSLGFEFAGQVFRVDPRDFGRPLGDPDAHWCVPNLAPTDPPQLGGYLYSWSVGEPFLRGVLASFYYGNLTHPSSDPPRIGFLSTVPGDAALRLVAAVRSAKSAGGYPVTTISAPTGTHTVGAVTTNPQGVLQASESPVPADLISAAASGQRRSECCISHLFCFAFDAKLDGLLLVTLLLFACAELFM